MNRKPSNEETMERVEAVWGRLKEIESHISDTPTFYTDKMKESYRECNGAYNDHMSRAMASDMFYFQPMFRIKYPELADLTLDWSRKMANFNIRLMRMFDDDKGGRPLTKWSTKKTYKLVKKIYVGMKLAVELLQKEDDKYLKDFIDRCKIWAGRVVYMNNWAFYLQNLTDVDRTYIQSQLEEYDADGKKIGGLDKTGMKLMESICRLRTELTKMLVHVPVIGEDHSYLMEKLEMLDTIGQIILGTQYEN